MPRYRVIPYRVEAERVPMTQDGDDLVAWGRLGVWLGTDEPWSVADGGVSLMTASGPEVAAPGDWIVRRADGRLFVFEHEQFLGSFIPTDGPYIRGVIPWVERIDAEPATAGLGKRLAEALDRVGGPFGG